MVEKKRFFILGLLVLILFSSFVSAQWGRYWDNPWDVGEGSENVIVAVTSAVEPFLRVLIGGDYYSSLFLFEKFLILLLLIAMVYTALRNVDFFSDQKAVLWTVAIIVPLISVRFLDIMWLNTILLQYKVLGVALAGILPFIIYFFFVHNLSESSTLRKILWIFFIIVYLGLWSTVTEPLYGEIYFWTIVVALILLLADGTIHNYYMERELIQSGNINKAQKRAEIRNQMDQVNSYPAHVMSGKEKQLVLRKLRKQLKKWT